MSGGQLPVVREWRGFHVTSLDLAIFLFDRDYLADDGKNFIVYNIV